MQEAKGDTHHMPYHSDCMYLRTKVCVYEKLTCTIGCELNITRCASEWPAKLGY